jgi:hypothetical protein
MKPNFKMWTYRSTFCLKIILAKILDLRWGTKSILGNSSVHFLSIYTTGLGEGSSLKWQAAFGQIYQKH